MTIVDGFSPTHNGARFSGTNVGLIAFTPYLLLRRKFIKSVVFSVMDYIPLKNGILYL